MIINGGDEVVFVLKYVPPHITSQNPHEGEWGGVSAAVSPALQVRKPRFNDAVQFGHVHRTN